MVKEWLIMVLRVSVPWFIITGCVNVADNISVISTDMIVETPMVENKVIVETETVEFDIGESEPDIESSPQLSIKDVDPLLQQKTPKYQEIIPMPQTTVIPDPSGPAELRYIQLAKEDLANNLNINPEDIEFLEFALVTWGDPSLGCPQPGMRYRQVPVDGYLIRLSYQGRTYNYHGSGSKGPFLCEQSSEK